MKDNNCLIPVDIIKNFVIDYWNKNQRFIDENQISESIQICISQVKEKTSDDFDWKSGLWTDVKNRINAKYPGLVE